MTQWIQAHEQAYAGQLLADDYGPYAYHEPERLSPLALLVGALIINAVSFARVDIGNHVAKVFGGILALAYIIRSMRARVRTPPEVWFYGAWVFWSLMGLFSGPVMFWHIWKRIILLLAFLLIVGGFTESRKALAFNMGAFLVGAAIMIGYGYATGGYRISAIDERATGMGGNANTFGWLNVLATFALACLWMRWQGKWLFKAAVLLPLIAAGALGGVLSGSRKAIIAMGLFYLCWVWFCYRKDVFRRLRILLAVLVLLGVGGGTFISLAGRGKTGERFSKTWDVLRGGLVRGGGAERIEIYRRSFNLFLEHPIIGVGLNNVKYRIGGESAHSEYLEVACDTGLPGFILYFSIFVVLWRRARKIAKHSADPVDVRIARLTLAVLVAVMVANLGRWNYDILDSWIIFASFIGFTHAAWERAKWAAAMADEPAYEEGLDEDTQPHLHAAPAGT